MTASVTQMQNRSIFESVRQFTQQNEQLWMTTPTLIADPNVKLLRMRLIMEELGELASAIHEGNLILTADGFCDLLYVVAGTGVSMGIPIVDPFVTPDSPEDAKLHNSRMSYLILGQLISAADKLFQSISQDNLLDINIYLQSFAEIIGYAASKFGIDFKECFYEVHRSNMTKTLGGAKDGKKYGADKSTVKGKTYSPPDLVSILSKQGLLG